LDLSAPHIGFVIAAYAVSGAAIVGLVVSTLVKLRVQEKKLADLQRHDKRRGSGKG
jgi:heme exporter protein CcmD